MKILFVFTGGTIGCKEINGIADVDSGVSQQIVSFCGGKGDEFEFAFPYNMLSENATCETLSQICTYMLSIDYDKYDGVILTHGSDTLAYTANLLGAALSWVKIPIVITAANYVMTDSRSNAKTNITAAYNFIKDAYNIGVFVSWQNRGEAVKLHPATGLLEADSMTDSFNSFGEAKKGNDLAFLKNRIINIKENVMLLHSYVGFECSSINLTGKEAVLLKLYHSGTACMSTFLKLAEMCRENNTDLYVTPIKNNGYIYSSALGFSKTEAFAFHDLTEYAAYTRLLLAYSLQGEEKSAVLNPFISKFAY